MLLKNVQLPIPNMSRVVRGAHITSEGLKVSAGAG